jgi:hypothetical protein
MLSVTSSYSRTADKAFLGLCAFSVVNPLIAQAAPFFFPGNIAGMNITQWFQGLCLPLVLVTLPALSKNGLPISRSFSRLFWAFVMVLSVLHLRLLAANRLSADFANTERMVYFKILFALLLWYYAARLVQSHDSAEKLLRWVLLGALASALWILVCYFFGVGSANYASAGIQATAGSEGVSGKAIAGFLLPAVTGAMFLALQKDSLRWSLAAVLMAAALFVTFDRSAQVALAVALCWGAVWWFGVAHPRPGSKAVLLFTCAVLLLGGVYYVHKGGEELMARWTQDLDRGEIGSGRGVFYATAWDWFWQKCDTTDFLLGMGYSNIYDLMYSASGLYVHTHSDLFDMLLAGGIAGLSLYVLLFGTIASLVRGLSSGCVEFAMLVALLVSFCVMSCLTGLIAFPLTMYTFGIECICIRVLACERDLDFVPATAASARRYPWSIAASAGQVQWSSAECLNSPGIGVNRPY